MKTLAAAREWHAPSEHRGDCSPDALRVLLQRRRTALQQGDDHDAHRRSQSSRCGGGEQQLLLHHDCAQASCAERADSALLHSGDVQHLLDVFLQ